MMLVHSSYLFVHATCSLEMNSLLHTMAIRSKDVCCPPGIENLSLPDYKISWLRGGELMETRESVQPEKIDEDEVSSEYFSATDTYQSILYHFRSRVC
uniref:Uncharacterized protein n=1 Tax=Salix viminalis TaxID=40686 RepID=A0A6N2LAY8_SALVM